jgi:hypothetical protein
MFEDSRESVGIENALTDSIVDDIKVKKRAAA